MTEPAEIIDALGVDRELVLRFFGVFSRFEFALKRAGFLKASQTAEADWERFANSLRGRFCGVAGSQFVAAIAFLEKAPPKKQVVSGGDIGWVDTPMGDGEHHEDYVLRLVRIVRNNLFHGGKYPVPVGPLEDVGRNRELLNASLVVLSECLQLSPNVRAAFDETA